MRIKNIRLNLILSAAVLFGVAAAQVQAQWIWDYQDDFSTGKAEKDSYSHSIIWPENAFPPAEPYLHYTKRYGRPAPAMMFMDYQGVPAHLNYCFPLGQVQGQRHVKGVLEFDAIFPPVADFAPPRGYLMYSLSPDGNYWTIPTAVEPGHHELKIASARGTCYVSFLGTKVILDNINVHLESPPVTYVVPGNFDTIQEAIDNSADGDIIEVLPNEDGKPYTGPGFWDIDFRGKAITVTSREGPENTVIDCEDPTDGTDGPDSFHRGFYFHSGETHESVLRGFTIINGYLPGSEIPVLDPDSGDSSDLRKAPIGAGILCEKSGPSIINCHIVKCKAEVGAGIGCIAGTPVITDCVITGCDAGGYGGSRSGGFGAGIGLLHKSEAAIINCRIVKNSTYWNSLGGGIYCFGSSAKIVRSEIVNNGAVNNDDGNMNGGGIYCGGRYSRLALENCIIADNIAHVGAGLYCEQGDNWGDDLPSEVPYCIVTVKNCTIANNTFKNQMPIYPAGGIYSDSCMISVSNSIIFFNDGPEIQIIDPYSNSPVNYCDVQGGFPGSGNIDSDPFFASNTAGGDYHLQSIYGRYNPLTGTWVNDNRHSPCIDTGNPKDSYDREPLPNGKRINMGAYGNTSQASKGVGYLVYHVDGINGNDSNSGLSRDDALRTIQAGINKAVDGDFVLVWPAIYKEGVEIIHKAITVQSAADAAVVQNTEGDAFTIVGAVDASNLRQTVLKNFVIRSSYFGISINDCSPLLTQLTVIDNMIGIAAYGDTSPDISNSIFYKNIDADLENCHASYSWFAPQLEPGDSGSEEDSDVDPYGQPITPRTPLFADYDGGDYHLKSRQGRYNPALGQWVIDTVDSPCIDRGNPRINPRKERMPNGGRLNQGAYGGTYYASMSPWPLRHDSNYDGTVNLVDFAVMAEEWLTVLPWINLPPVVKIIRPEDGQIIPSAIETILIEAKAYDHDGSVVKVEFYANNLKIGEDTDPENGWSMPWWNFVRGHHELTARATDDDGTVSVSESVNIYITKYWEVDPVNTDR